MEAMFGRFRPEKGRVLLRNHQEITRKIGRHVVTDRKVWPSYDETKMPDAKEVAWIEEG